MNSNELDTFLKKLSPIEEMFCINRNEGSKNSDNFFAIAPFLTEETVKKFPFINDAWNGDYLIHPERAFNDNMASHPYPKGGIVFSCHPRFNGAIKHHHDCIEMMYVYAGRCSQTINGKQVTMNKDDVCILDTNVVHEIDAVGEDDIIINCLMSRSYVDNILIGRLSENNLLSGFLVRAIYQSNSTNNYILFRSNKSSKITNLMQETLCEYYDKALCSNEIIDSYMIIIFAELIRIFAADNNKANYDIGSKKISDIISYVQDNCKDTNLTSTADHFHFHPSYVSYIIKKYTGKKFTDILHDAKLEKACILLKNSDISVLEIANEVGYENTTFFYEIFKKHYGCTPTEYRNKFKAKNTYVD